MSGTAPPPRLDPPMQELPHDDLGRPTQPWANYYQGITDRLARAGFGTTTNDDAAAGTIGEFMTATVAGPGVGIGNNFASNIASLPLTAGDWDVRGEVWFRLGVGPTGDVEAGISQVAGALPANPGQGSRTTQTFTHTANSGQVLALAPCRMSLAAAATVYLVAVCGFSGGSTTAYGRIEGRRIR